MRNAFKPVHTMTPVSRFFRSRSGGFSVLALWAIAAAAWGLVVTLLSAEAGTAKIVGAAAAAGVTTEIALWSSAVFLGVSVFRKIADRFGRKGPGCPKAKGAQ